MTMLMVYRCESGGYSSSDANVVVAVVVTSIMSVLVAMVAILMVVVILPVVVYVCALSAGKW